MHGAPQPRYWEAPPAPPHMLTTTIEISLIFEALVSKIARLLRNIDPAMRVFQKLQAAALPFCSGVAKLKKYSDIYIPQLPL